MAIRHAILGLIAEQPMHGYRLKEVFAQRVSPLWGLTTGQIYQSLGALERNGLLESRGERAGRRPARRIYSVTVAGRRELTTWLSAPETASPRFFRDDLLLRMLFLHDSDAARLLGVLEREMNEVTLLMSRIAHIRDDASPETASGDVRTTFLEGMLHHLDADVTVLERCRDQVLALLRSRDSSVPAVADRETTRTRDARSSRESRRSAAAHLGRSQA